MTRKWLCGWPKMGIYYDLLLEENCGLFVGNWAILGEKLVCKKEMDRLK